MSELVEINEGRIAIGEVGLDLPWGKIMEELNGYLGKLLIDRFGQLQNPDLDLLLRGLQVRDIQYFPPEVEGTALSQEGVQESIWLSIDQAITAQLHQILTQRNVAEETARRFQVGGVGAFLPLTANQSGSPFESSEAAVPHTCTEWHRCGVGSRTLVNVQCCVSQRF